MAPSISASSDPTRTENGLASPEKEPYLAVCANDSPYAEYERFDLKDLPKVSYIEEKGENDLLRQFQQLGITPPKPSFTSQNTYSMLAMVSHNLGVCILPELVVRDISKMLSGCRSIRRWSACSASGFRQQKSVPGCQPADRAAAADSV